MLLLGWNFRHRLHRKLSKWQLMSQPVIYISSKWHIRFSVNVSLGRALQWRHKERDGVSNHQPRDCLLNRLFRRRSTKTSKLRLTGLCEGNSPVNSPHKGPVTRKMFPFDDVIMVEFYMSTFIMGYKTYEEYVKKIYVLNMMRTMCITRYLRLAYIWAHRSYTTVWHVIVALWIRWLRKICSWPCIISVGLCKELFINMT